MITKKQAADWLIDLLALCGAASVVYGVSEIHPPSAYIVAGVCVVSLAIMRARRWDS